MQQLSKLYTWKTWVKDRYPSWKSKEHRVKLLRQQQFILKTNHTTKLLLQPCTNCQQSEDNIQYRQRTIMLH